MEFQATPLSGCVIVHPRVFGDDRGFFLETYHARKFQEAGIDLPFVQDNHSHSRKNVVRGLHHQRKHPQGKLVRVVQGAIFDVAVDLREGSLTRGQWFGVVLSAELRNQFYIPPGFAHGFSVLSERADVLYKCTDFYAPQDEQIIQWNDPDLAIDWQITGTPIVSERDARGIPFRSLGT